jgi:hypothetical protein
VGYLATLKNVSSGDTTVPYYRRKCKMRFTRRETTIGIIGLVIGVLMSGSLIWVFAQDDTSAPAPTTSASTPSVTEESAGARNPAQGLACWAVPLTNARSIMGDQTLAVVDTDSIGNTPDCMYLSPSKKTLVSLQVYREATPDIKAAYQAIVDDYEEHKGEPYYRKASVSSWPTGPNHAMPTAMFAFTVHTRKYGHDLVYVNDGYYTVRIRVLPGQHEQMFALAETALVNLKPFHK